MSSFTKSVPAGATLRGVGVATKGLRLRVHDAQPIGAPALRGNFTLLSDDDAHASLMDTHLAEDVSHNAYVAVLLATKGSDASFDDVHATLVQAVGPDPRLLETLNRNLFHRQAWAVDTSVEPIGGPLDDVQKDKLVVGSSDFEE